jgi:integrative and conjugative element protein (TIGR02256 family)
MIHSYKISDEAFALIISESTHHFPNETGGMLVGRIELNCVVIQYATGPGPTAQHTPTKFKRDGDYSQEALKALVRESKGQFDYIGEWHSHPFKSNPSSLDIASMSWIAANENYAIHEPVMLLCVGSGINRWKLRCYLLVNNKLKTLKSTT